MILKQPGDGIMVHCNHRTRRNHWQVLKDFLWLSKGEEHKRRLPILQGLRAKKIPVELLVLIRDHLAIGVLADLLKIIYSIPFNLAEYLAADVMLHRKEYSAFSTYIFQHNWLKPCAPPVTNKSLF